MAGDGGCTRRGVIIRCDRSLPLLTGFQFVARQEDLARLAGNSGALLHGGWDDDRTASTVGPSLGSQFTRHNYGGLRSLWVAQQAPK